MTFTSQKPIQKFLFFTLLILSLCSGIQARSSIAPPSSPLPKDPKELIDVQLVSLEHLIEMTKLSLSQMNHLHREITAYKQIQERYLENIDDKALLYQMVTKGNSLLLQIKKDHLLSLFNGEFIDELKLLSQLHKKMRQP